MLTEQRILLIIGGGIAAYKCLDLIRRLKERGAGVRVILTDAARQFVTPLAVGAISGERVFTDLFDLTAEHDIGHIRLSREADLVVVAPATADLLAKMAGGHADDLASTALIATDKPVLVAPAMNPRMWAHPATRRNMATLIAAGLAAPPPAAGAMAERRVLVTSGPTHEPIDPVRFIANRSSGKQGHAVAAAAAAAGAEVVLVSGPAEVPDPAGVRVVHVETARQMLAAVEAALPADVGIFAAAVADWRVADASEQKIKKGEGGTPTLTLVENPDILATISRHPSLRPPLVVGFAAETENVIAHAEHKRARKGCDWIVANDVSPATGIMGGDSNTVHLVSAAGVEHWPPAPKGEVAARLVARIADALTAGAQPNRKEKA